MSEVPAERSLLDFFSARLKFFRSLLEFVRARLVFVRSLLVFARSRERGVGALLTACKREAYGGAAHVARHGRGELVYADAYS